MGTTNNNTSSERASAGAGATACPCGAETNGAEGSRTHGRNEAEDRGYTALQVLDLLNAQQVALLAGAEKRAARLREAVFAAGKAAGAPEGLEPVALAEWLGQRATIRATGRLWGVELETPAEGSVEVPSERERVERAMDRSDAQALRGLRDALNAVGPGGAVLSVTLGRGSSGNYSVCVARANHMTLLESEPTILAACQRASEWAARQREAVSIGAPKTQPAPPARERREVGGPEDAFHAVFTREYGASRWVYGCEHIADELRDNFYFKAQNGVKVYSHSHPAIGDEEVFLRGIHKNRDLETRILSGNPGRYIDALREALPVARERVERARRAAKGGAA